VLGNEARNSFRGIQKAAVRNEYDITSGENECNQDELVGLEQSGN
jgi:hypothetical protein